MHTSMNEDAPIQATQQVTEGQRTGLWALLTSFVCWLPRSGEGSRSVSRVAMTGRHGEARGGETRPDVVIGGVLPLCSFFPTFEACKVVDEEFAIQWSKMIFLQKLKQS